MTTTPLGPGERAPARTDDVDTVTARGSDEGPAAAALLAAGVGAFALGLFTTVAEISESFKDALVITEPVGPLSGKTTYAVAIWLVTWAVLQVTLGRRARLSPAVLTVTAVLLGLGLLGTFPIFFEAFAAE